ncbi:hypothetical protein EFK97_06370 [Lactococcus lactis subsp. lactis]|nr:hypothetical protein [Lactococcus lactis subsp. lactis]
MRGYKFKWIYTYGLFKTHLSEKFRFFVHLYQAKTVLLSDFIFIEGENPQKITIYEKNIIKLGRF